MPTVMCISANGRTTKLMAKDSTCTLTALSTKACGVKTNSMDGALRLGLMAQSTKASTPMEGKTAKVTSTGAMEPALSDSSTRTTSTVKASTRGQMVASTKETGLETRCMALVCSATETAESILENSGKTRKKVMAA